MRLAVETLDELSVHNSTRSHSTAATCCRNCLFVSKLLSLKTKLKGFQFFVSGPKNCSESNFGHLLFKHSFVLATERSEYAKNLNGPKRGFFHNLQIVGWKQRHARPIEMVAPPWSLFMKMVQKMAETKSPSTAN